MELESLQVQRGKEFLKDVNLCSEFIRNFIDNEKIPVKETKYPRPGDVVMAFKKRLTGPSRYSDTMENLLSNFNALLMPSLINWKHNQNFGFFPPGNAIPNIFGDMLSTSIGGVGFSWTCQPALTELENLMIDWFAKLLNLPDVFSFENSQEHAGGGSIQNSGTDAIYNTMVAARFRTLLKMGAFGGSIDHLETSATLFGQEKKGTLISHPGKLVRQFCCFASYEAHSSFRKAARLALLDYILIETPNDHGELYLKNLQTAYNEATSNNKKPIYTLLSLGTPTGCAFDKLGECGSFCNEMNMWCHVNASYAGNALILHTEFINQLRSGLEYADSINISPYKMLLCAPDLALLWVKNRASYVTAFLMGAEYLLNRFAGSKDPIIRANSIEYRDYGVPLTRRMRALKIFFVLQMYGKTYLENIVDHKFQLAKAFASELENDDRYKIMNDVQMGIVVFRQEDPSGGDLADDYTLSLLANLQSRNKIIVTPCHVKQDFAIRLSVNDEFASDGDIQIALHEVQSQTVELLQESPNTLDPTKLRSFLNRGHMIQVSADKYQTCRKAGFRKYEEDAGPIIITVTDNLSETFQLILQHDERE